jgi:hypothetical protein
LEVPLVHGGGWAALLGWCLLLFSSYLPASLLLFSAYYYLFLIWEVYTYYAHYSVWGVLELWCSNLFCVQSISSCVLLILCIHWEEEAGLLFTLMEAGRSSTNTVPVDAHHLHCTESVYHSCSLLLMEVGCLYLLCVWWRYSALPLCITIYIWYHWKAFDCYFCLLFCGWCLELIHVWWMFRLLDLFVVVVQLFCC